MLWLTKLLVGIPPQHLKDHNKLLLWKEHIESDKYIALLEFLVF